MKSKRTLKLLLFMAIILAIVVLINLVKADGTGNLVLNLEIDEGTNTHQTPASYFSYMSYQLKDSSGNPIAFDENFATINDVTIENGTIIKIASNKWTSNGNGNYTFTLSNIPNGTYTFEFVGSDYSEDTYRERYNAPISTTQNPAVTINGDSATVNQKMLVTLSRSFNLYYLDQSDHTPSVIFQFARDTDHPFTYTYSRDDSGNNVYTYDINSTDPNVVVVSGEKTIVKDLPGVQTCSYRIQADLKYGDKLFSYSRGISCSGTSPQELYSTYWDSIELPYDRDVGYFAECANVQRVAIVEKKDNDGTARNFSFKLRNLNESSGPLYMNYEHYDTYTLNGTEYTNVYVLNGSLSETAQELSTVNGKATIIYPQTYEKWIYEAESRHSYYAQKMKLGIYETDADDDLLFNPYQSVAEISENDYQKSTTYDGVVPQFSYWQADIDYSKFESHYEELSDDVRNIEIENTTKPYITKRVVDENGDEVTNCTDTYTFGLYTYNKQLISTVTVKANETNYFDVDYDHYGTNDTTGVLKYIAEIKKDNSELIAIESDYGEDHIFTEAELAAIEENVYANGYTYQAITGVPFSATFTNQIVTTSISGEKTWDDENNAAGKRPSEIVVILLADGTPLTRQTVQVDEQGKWTYEFTKLPKYKNGAEIVYTVDELPVEQYQTIVDGHNIINKIIAPDNTDNDSTDKPSEESDENTSTSDSADTDEEKTSSKSAKTGDNIAIYIGLLSFALTTIAATRIRIRRAKK